MYNTDIAQLDGNISCDSSVITESQCSCCDKVSGWDTTSISDFDICIKRSHIPVLVNFRKGEEKLQPPPWYDEYILC